MTLFAEMTAEMDRLKGVFEANGYRVSYRELVVEDGRVSVANLRVHLLKPAAVVVNVEVTANG